MRSYISKISYMIFYFILRSKTLTWLVYVLIKFIQICEQKILEKNILLFLVLYAVLVKDDESNFLNKLVIV